jgi:hypothetical protein
MISLSNESKNSVSLVNERRTNEITWNEVTETWDDSVSTWENRFLGLAKESKTKISLSNEADPSKISVSNVSKSKTPLSNPLK